MQLDKEFLALERNFPNFRPRKCVDARYALEHSNAHVSHSQIQWCALHIFGRMHFHSVQFTPPGRLQQIQVRLGRRLTVMLLMVVHDLHLQ